MSYGDCIPMQIQDELLAWRDADTRSSWRLGAIVQEVIDFNLQNDQDYRLDYIYGAVGVFAGKASRTIREFYYIWKFYPPEIQEAYSILSYDHYRIAVRLGDRWRDALEWAVTQVDTLNRPCSVDAMFAHFAPPDPGMPEPPPGLVDGPAGMFHTIYQSVSQQAQASQFWIDHGGLSAEILVHVRAYHWAASQIAEMLDEVRK